MDQIIKVNNLILDYDEVHHGDCIGADADMHQRATENYLRTVGHPPSDPKLRAFCEFDELWPEKPYLDRNKDIVDSCHVLLATPKESTEQQRGGTWSTIRYARKKKKPVLIVWPDGTVSGERLVKWDSETG